MRLPSDAAIAIEKMADYLLRGDLRMTSRSSWLKQAILNRTQISWLRISDDNCLHWKRVLKKVQSMARCNSTVGWLTGPNGRELRVVSIWMMESATDKTKFITLYPAKED